RTKVLPLAACADAQLVPGSCLDTAQRSHAPSPPVFVAKTLCGRPIVANLNLSLSLTHQQALWLGPGNRLGAGVIVPAVERDLSPIIIKRRSRDSESFAKPHLQPFYLKLNRSA